MNDKTKLPQGLVCIGYGGHARSVADVAMSLGINAFVFVDTNARENETFAGFPVVRQLPEKLAKGWSVFPTSGSGVARQQAIAKADTLGWPVASVISPTASIGWGSKISRGVFVAHQVHIGPLVELHEGCLINSGAVVDHDSVVGAYTHVSVNATMAGSTRIGCNGFVGAGASVIDKVSITDDVTLGAGAAAVKNIVEAGTYVGVPAKRIHTR